MKPLVLYHHVKYTFNPYMHIIRKVADPNEAIVLDSYETTKILIKLKTREMCGKTQLPEVKQILER